MAKILSYKDKSTNIITIASLIVAIVITNSFIVFSQDENSRSYFSNLTTTLTVAAPMVIAFVMVFKYKRSMKKVHSQQYTQDIESCDDNKMHLSICSFLVLWFIAHLIWSFKYQQSSDVSIQDILWFIGYGFFGYFLYSLYYHFFRKELEPLVPVLIAIIISIVLVFVLDIIVSILRLLSTQTLESYVLSVTLAYPILDAIMIFPAVLIFLAVRKVSSMRTSTVPGQNGDVNSREDKVTSLVSVSSIWILLLSISMILSTIGDTGFAFSTAYGPDTIQRDVWIWDIFYNSCGLCLAAALIGYKSFFSFNSVDALRGAKDLESFK
jgi:hypothetical protein